LIEALIAGLELMITPGILSVILLGSAIGFVFGVMPGLGGILGLTLALPFTFGWDPLVAMFLYAGIMGCISEGGSVTAILLNTPGTPINAATCFDGYPMARRGEAGRALGLAAASSSLGALFGIVVLLLLIPVVRPIVLAFGAPEMFWLVLFGLVTIAFTARGNLFKGLAAGGLGVLLSLIGYSDVFGVLRWTGGSEYLWDGFELVPLFLGIFAISEMITYTAQGGSIAAAGSERMVVRGIRPVLRGAREMFHYPKTFLRGSVIGTLIGIIPGIGGSVANFISYSTAMQSSKNRALFGTGHPEGIIASEVANDAKDGGALFPTLAFGIPGSPEMAVLLGALTLHGIQPGPLIIRDHLDIVVALILGLVASNLLAGFTLLFLANALARLTFVKVYYIAPVVLVLVTLGAFALRSNVWDVGLAILAGVFGFALKRSGYPVITLAIGFVLGEIAESAFHQSLSIAYGSYSIFFTRPIGVILMVLIVLTFALPLIRRSHWLRVIDDRQARESKPYRKGPCIVTALVFLVVLIMITISFTYRADVREIPLMVGIATLLLLLASFGVDFFPGKFRALEIGIESLWGGALPERSKDPIRDDKTGSINSVCVFQVIAWLIGFFVLILLIGFMFSIPIFLLTFLIFQGRTKWLNGVVVTAGVCVLLYFSFLKALAIDVWPGMLPEIIPGILGGGIIPPL